MLFPGVRTLLSRFNLLPFALREKPSMSTSRPARADQSVYAEYDGLLMVNRIRTQSLWDMITRYDCCGVRMVVFLLEFQIEIANGSASCESVSCTEVTFTQAMSRKRPVQANMVDKWGGSGDLSNCEMSPDPWVWWQEICLVPARSRIVSFVSVPLVFLQRESEELKLWIHF